MIDSRSGAYPPLEFDSSGPLVDYQSPYSGGTGSKIARWNGLRWDFEFVSSCFLSNLGGSLKIDPSSGRPALPRVTPSGLHYALRNP